MASLDVPLPTSRAILRSAPRRGPGASGPSESAPSRLALQITPLLGRTRARNCLFRHEKATHSTDSGENVRNLHKGHSWHGLWRERAQSAQRPLLALILRTTANPPRMSKRRAHFARNDPYHETTKLPRMRAMCDMRCESLREGAPLSVACVRTAREEQARMGAISIARCDGAGFGGPGPLCGSSKSTDRARKHGGGWPRGAGPLCGSSLQTGLGSTAGDGRKGASRVADEPLDAGILAPPPRAVLLQSKILVPWSDTRNWLAPRCLKRCTHRLCVARDDVHGGGG